MKVYSKCLKPCITMDVKLKEVHVISNLAFYGGIEINIHDEEIIVYTDTYAYDMFSLIVDLGSALGLWLGLSALSIFDYVIEALIFSKTFCFQWFKKPYLKENLVSN